MLNKESFINFNKGLERFMPLLTPSGVILGLLIGTLFGSRVAVLKPAVTYLFAFITFVGALGMKFSDFSYVVKRPLIVLLSLIGSHVIMPVGVYLIGSLIFHGQKDVIIGFVLLYSIPTAVVSYIWCSIYKGNGILSLALILIGTVLAPFITPYSIRLISGTAVKIDTTNMMLSLIYMVVLPSILGLAFNTFSNGKAKVSVAPYLKPFTKLALMAVITINSSQVALSLRWGFDLIGILGINVCFSVCGLLLGYFLGYVFKLSMMDRVSLTYAVGLRNISAALVLAINFFPPQSSVPVMIGITTQQIVAATVGKLLLSKRSAQSEE